MKIFFQRTNIASVLCYAQTFHPRESILLLKGKVEKDITVFSDVQFPSLGTLGSSFSGFHLITLPIDFSVIILPTRFYQVLSKSQL